jgi:hypothetical protein
MTLVTLVKVDGAADATAPHALKKLSLGGGFKNLKNPFERFACNLCCIAA